MLRIIREEDPPKPSSRLAASSSQISRTAETRSSDKRDRKEPAKLLRMVKGELDWIVMKAMDKDRSRRYETPSALANDIERYLSGDAVAACPPSTLYAFRKFARRNKVMLATSAIVAASLVLGLIGTSWQTVRALRAEQDAVSAGKKAADSDAESQAMNRFLTEDLLGLASAESQRAAGLTLDANLKLVTTFDRALAQLDQRFPASSPLKARLQDTLASSYSSIGRYKDAVSLYEKLLDYLTSNQGSQDAFTIRTMRHLGKAYFDLSQFDDAELNYDQAFAISSKFLGEDNPLTLLILNDLGVLYQKQHRYEESESAYDECLRTRRKALGDEHADTLITMSNLATLDESRDRFDEAEVLHQQVLEIRRRKLPAHDPSIADALHNLGRHYLKRGRHDRDPELFERSLPLLSEGLQDNLQDQVMRGASHPATLGIRADLVQVFLEQRRFDEAVPMLEDLVQRLVERRSAEHVSTLEAMNMLGWVYMQQDRLEEAENIFAKLLKSPRLSDPAEIKTRQVRGNLAITYYRLGKLEESISVDKATLKSAEGKPGSDDIETLACMTRLGLSCLESDREGEGRTLLESVLNADSSLPRAPFIAGALANSYARDQDFKQAIQWTDRQIQNAQNTLTNDNVQLAEILRECQARRSMLNAKLENESDVNKIQPIKQ